ncbi:uncharacterized protein LOC126662083 [Mercurialis annua]|uniref:uncharacterized protein LOC126662083 n=1 Tax=Mercurialis annua TaxID=3986 RepID=UPI0021602BFF|nr:uncharacterized protein LOC126662083 [Mercurialis annua]
MADFMNQILSKPLQLANQAINLAKGVDFFKQECDQIKHQIENLVAILNLMVAQGSSVSYQRPLQRTVAETEQVLDGVIALLLKCGGDGIRKLRVFVIIPTAVFQKTLSQLESSVDDFTQILRLLEYLESHSYEHLDHPRDSLDVHHDDRQYQESVSDVKYNYLRDSLELYDDILWSDLSDEDLGVHYCSHHSIEKYIPPIVYNDPDIFAFWKLIETGDYHLHQDSIDGYLNVVSDSLKATSTNLQFHNILWAVWPLIGNLYHTSQDRRSFGVKLLLLVSQLSDNHKKVIIEEGAVSPLLKLMEEGGIEDQETAAKVIGTLGYDSESVIRMIDAGVCLKFGEVLKEGPMKVQAEVAWAISEFTANCPNSQDVFLQLNIVYLLIKHHLSFETVRLDQNAFVINKATSVLSMVTARSRLDRQKAMDESDDNKNYKSQNPSLRSTSLKDRELEEPKTKHQMQAMTARALCSLVKGNLPICCCIAESRALMWFVVLLDIGTEDLQYHSAMALMEIAAVAEEDTELRRSTFKRGSPVFKTFVDQLMKIIENPKSNLLIPSVKTIGYLAKTFRMTEARAIDSLAVNSLEKFACPENFLHIDYSKEIIRAGGVKLLLELVRLGDMKLSAYSLLFHLASYVPEDNAVAEAKALFEWKQASISLTVTQDKSFDSLLTKAKSKLALFYMTSYQVFMLIIPNFAKKLHKAMSQQHSNCNLKALNATKETNDWLIKPKKQKADGNEIEHYITQHQPPDRISEDITQQLEIKHKAQSQITSSS